MGNVFTNNGELGIKLRDELLTRKITTREAFEVLENNGIKSSLSNIRELIARYRKKIAEKQLVIIDRPPEHVDFRTTMEEVKNRLIKKPEEAVKPLWIIENALLDLERVKIDFGRGSREYLASLKIQTDIAIDLYKLAPQEEKVNVGDVLKSFDNITEFVEILHKKHNELNIRDEYLVFIEKKRLGTT